LYFQSTENTTNLTKNTTNLTENTTSLTENTTNLTENTTQLTKYAINKGNNKNMSSDRFASIECNK
jgi:hypothetical protein